MPRKRLTGGRAVRGFPSATSALETRGLSDQRPGRLRQPPEEVSPDWRAAAAVRRYQDPAERPLPQVKVTRQQIEPFDGRSGEPAGNDTRRKILVGEIVLAKVEQGVLEESWGM